MRATTSAGMGLLAGIVLALVRPGTVHAKGRDVTVFPQQAAWGETVYLNGFNWPAGVTVSARFAPTRSALAAVPLAPLLHPARFGGDPTFVETVRVDHIAGQRPGPGWVEFVARAGDEEAAALLVIVAGDRRPAGAGFVEGRVLKLPTSDGPVTSDVSPPSTRATFLAVAPAADPTAVRLEGLLNDGNDGGSMGEF